MNKNWKTANCAPALLFLSVIYSQLSICLAATNVVYNSNDSGAGSLRKVIQDSSSGDTIIFSNVITGKIMLTSGELLISNKNLTILGPGVSVLSVDGDAASRVFHLTDATVSIYSLTITKGSAGNTAGGGIYNDHSTLTVSNCIVSGNMAGEGGGIYNNAKGGSANLSVIASFVFSNYATTLGGGIYNDGESGGSAILTLSNCTLSGNYTTNNGGGICNDGENGNAKLWVMASVLSNNYCGSTLGRGGGIFNDGSRSGVATVVVAASALNDNQGGSGAGIFNDGEGGCAILGVTNCTFVGNKGYAGAGISNDGSAGSATLKVIACTFSDNLINSSLGNCIYNFGGPSATLEIGDTILASPSGAHIYSHPPSLVVTDGYNLSDGTESGFTALTDQLRVNPMLGPMWDNGGPTPTMALLPGSPAIDKGNAFGLATDQRGLPRPFDFPSIFNATGGDGSDIGAFEVGRPNPSIVFAAPRAVVLSWPAYDSSFNIQAGTNLSVSNTWTAVAGAPLLLISNRYFLTNSATELRKFYRLSSP